MSRANLIPLDEHPSASDTSATLVWDAIAPAGAAACVYRVYGGYLATLENISGVKAFTGLFTSEMNARRAILDATGLHA